MLRVFTRSTILLLAIFTAPHVSFAQDGSTDPYFTTSGEIIFSWADFSDESLEGNIIRFSPFFNLQTYVNKDYSQHFGTFLGFSIRNVGFIYEDDTSNVKMKYRTYNLGIPVGVKIGNVDGGGLGFFLGYELEVPINYKEKTFINEDKEDKTNIWFSDRVTTFNSSVMAGVQFPYGTTIKFKYYLSNFFNKDFEETESGITYKPYSGTDVNIFYVSLAFGLFRNSEFYYTEPAKDTKTELRLKK